MAPGRALTRMVRTKLYLVATDGKIGSNNHRLWPGRFRADIRNKTLHLWDSAVQERVTQKSCSISTPEDFHDLGGQNQG